MYIIVTNNEEVLNAAKKNKSQILEMTEENLSNVKVIESPSLSNNILNFLIELGLRPDLKGFDYLKFIIENRLDYVNGITTMIYPCVAEHFNTTPSRVERSIRHLIATRNEQLPDDHLYKNVFGTIKNNLTNKQFIAGCMQYLKVNRI